MSTRLWGVKRPDGTMIQSQPKDSMTWALVRAEAVDVELCRLRLGSFDRKLRRARRAGYSIVRAEVVEVKP